MYSFNYWQTHLLLHFFPFLEHVWCSKITMAENQSRGKKKKSNLCRISICFPICAITIVSIFLLSIYSVFWREKNKLSRIRSFEVLWRWYIINTARLVSYHQSKNKPHLFIYTDQLHLRFHLCFLAYFLM